jgi:sialidase-1
MKAIIGGIVLLFSVLVPVRAATAQPAAYFEQQVLFKASQDPGYACFRIPAIVRTTHGTLLAFAEGRVNNCGDAGDIDLVLKRSSDGGSTWSPLSVVNAGGGDTHGNPVPIVDRVTGRIILITTYNKGRTDSGGCATPCPRTPHEQYSDDDGVTWSAPVDISAQASRPDWDSWYASGPVHGIQLTHGRQAGRLVFGVNAETSNGVTPIANHAALIYSDDHGASWHVGAVDTFGFSPGATFTQKPSEVSLAELPDGTIYAAGREQSGTDIGNRDYAISRDGGQTFAQPFTTIPDLVTPMVQGSVLRLSDGRMLFSSPSDTDRRRWMMIRSSYDAGRTWENADQGTLITSDWSGYSDLVQTGSSDIGLLYEGGAVDARDEIRFARFDEAYLGSHNSAGPVTPDSSHHADAHVLGGASVTAGRFGGGLQLDGTDDYVRVPWSPAQPPGAGDFTWTAWFRYGASTAPQVLLWMGGMGTTAPQMWLRGEPANHRLIAMTTTAGGSRSISSKDAYADQAWHHVALERTGGLLLMYVDGAFVASGPDAPGSVSQTVSFQIQIGQRLDNTFRFDGTLDEVRIYNRALSAAELDQVRLRNADPRRGEVLRLPFDKLHGES